MCFLEKYNYTLKSLNGKFSFVGYWEEGDGSDLHKSGSSTIICLKYREFRQVIVRDYL
jgi:hypothetical protein